MIVRLTPPARAQLLAAVAYIHAERPTAARDFRMRVNGALGRLVDFPESGRVIPEFSGLGFREVLVGSYRLFYRVQGSVVWVVGVWHDAQIPHEPEQAVKGESPMRNPDEVDTDVGIANPGPFVVSDPCRVCGGQGVVEGKSCFECRGTGVQRFYHGTKADLKIEDLIEPGHTANFGDIERTTTYVYFTGTLDAATWGAELALGEGQGRIYIVKPLGAIEDDPNLTDKKFPGNPTKSYRSRESLRVVGEVLDWQGHSAEQLRSMKGGLERLKQQGVEPID